MSARAFYDAVKVNEAQAPYDTIHLKIYYRGSLDDSMEQINMGVVPADADATPWPIVILMPGTNVPVESYSWLAKHLAENGIVAVLYSWIKEDMPGFICQSPGIELKNLTPNTYGTAPTASALPALYSALERANRSGVLQNRLDLNSVIIGGHSAGGSAALLNNNPAWFPWLKGCFTYAAHAAASNQLGFPDDSMLSICPDLPYLLMAGSRDGVIAASSFRYGDANTEDNTDRIKRTFKESIAREQNDTHFVKIRGANHFSFTHPSDSATGRQFLDWAIEGSDDDIRACMATLITAFIKGQILGDKLETEIFSTTIKSDPLIVEHYRK